MERRGGGEEGRRGGVVPCHASSSYDLFCSICFNRTKRLVISVVNLISEIKRKQRKEKRKYEKVDFNI